MIILFLILVFSCDTTLFKLNFPNLGLGGLFISRPLTIADTEATIKSIKAITELYTYRYYSEGILRIYKDIPKKIDAKNFNKSFSWQLDEAKKIFINSCYTRSGDTYILKDNISYENLTKLKMILDSVDYANIYNKSYRLISTYKGFVYVGYELSKIKKEHVLIREKSITIRLPKPKVLDVVIRPEDFKEYDQEKGIWYCLARYPFFSNNTVSSLEFQDAQLKAQNILARQAIYHGLLIKSEKRGIKIIKKFFKSLGFNNIKVIFI